MHSSYVETSQFSASGELSVMSFFFLVAHCSTLPDQQLTLAMPLVQTF